MNTTKNRKGHLAGLGLLAALAACNPGGHSGDTFPAGGPLVDGQVDIDDGDLREFSQLEATLAYRVVDGVRTPFGMGDPQPIGGGQGVTLSHTVSASESAVALVITTDIYRLDGESWKYVDNTLDILPLDHAWTDRGLALSGEVEGWQEPRDCFFIPPISQDDANSEVDDLQCDLPDGSHELWGSSRYADE